MSHIEQLKHFSEIEITNSTMFFVMEHNHYYFNSIKCAINSVPPIIDIIKSVNIFVEGSVGTYRGVCL